MGKKLDITGKTFNNLRAIKNTGEKYQGAYIWEFECLLCGKKIKATAKSVVHGDRKSCGCVHIKNLKTMPIKEKLGLVDGTNVSRILSKKLQKNNTTGHTGVSVDKRKNTYFTYVYFKGKRYYLGSYARIDDAIKARESAEEALHGNFLNWYASNFPERWNKISKKDRE